MITKYLPLIGAFNTSMLYMLLMGGMVGAVFVFFATKVLGSLILFPPDKAE